jgi:hypothetical protein
VLYELIFDEIEVISAKVGEKSRFIECPELYVLGYTVGQNY